MYSRIDTLIEKFELKDRKFNEKIDETHINIDYSHIDKILIKEREKVNKFLIKALDIEV